MQKLLKRVGHIVTGILIIVIVFAIWNVLQMRKNPNELPTVMGFKFMSVLTGSMRPVLEPGDMIITQDVKAENLRKGDIITYRVDKHTLVTHRVAEVVNVDGELLFKTRGDANNVDDRNLVSAEHLVGTLLLAIPKGGYITNFIKSGQGFLIFIIMPAILLIGLEFKNIMVMFSQKAKNNTKPKDV